MCDAKVFTDFVCSPSFYALLLVSSYSILYIYIYIHTNINQQTPLGKVGFARIGEVGIHWVLMNWIGLGWIGLVRLGYEVLVARLPDVFFVFGRKSISWAGLQQIMKHL